MSTLITLDLLVTFAFFLVVICAVFVYSAVFWSLFRDAPFVPSPKPVAESMMDLAEVKSGETVTDLGSGHGEILIAAGRRGARARGYELSRVLVLITMFRKYIQFPRADLRVFRRDFYGADLRGTNVVACYLFPKSMERMSDKFKSELAPGSRVVSAAFAIPDWTPVKTIRVANRPIYLYVI